MKRVDASKPLAFLGVPADGVHFLQELCNYTNYPASENVKCYHSADQRQNVLEKKKSETFGVT